MTMKTPKKVEKYLFQEKDKMNGEYPEKEVDLLSEDELDSVAGGVAPIIKPPIPPIP